MVYAMEGLNRSKKGLTLVELMVASTVFALAIAGSFAGLLQGFNFIEGSRHYTRVSQVMQSELEYLRSLSWVDLNELPTSEEITPSSQFNSTFYDDYTIERRIISETPSLRRVEIEVTFSGSNRSGSEISLSFVTYFTQGGLNDYYYRQI